MAHCPYSELADLEPALREIRTWPDVREPSPGVFYVKRLPFLHFHIKDGVRWADARKGAKWGPKIPAPRAAWKTFLAAARRYYRATVEAV
jgi:hypothetical protein